MWWSHPFLSLPHLLYWYVGTSYLTRNAQCRSLNATQISIWISSLQWPVVTVQKHVMCVKKLNCVLYPITKTNRRRESPGLEMLKNITRSDAVTEAKSFKRGNCNSKIPWLLNCFWSLCTLVQSVPTDHSVCKPLTDYFGNLAWGGLLYVVLELSYCIASAANCCPVTGITKVNQLEQQRI